MRKIICRFENKNDLDIIGKKLGLNLCESVKEINLNTKEIKIKKQLKNKSIKKADWKQHWNDMPEFNVDFKNEVYAKIDILFDDYEYVNKLFEQKITTKTKSIWYPKLIHGKHRDLRVIGGENPKYPIYVISKNRSECKSWHTSFRLSQMGVYHYLVVEPQQYDEYIKNFNNEYVKVITMDMKYKDEYDVFSDLGNKESCGPGATRNFCWDHSINNGFEFHWVLDDNIDGFHRYWRGHRILCRTGGLFRSCEKFVERYENIGIAGLNYSNFCRDGDNRPAYVLNTRIYSALLIKNNLQYRWRGRYNEDTDLSLRVLKSGLCTVEFNLFLSGKECTQRHRGGNTDEFYANEGTAPKSQMLVDMHPDVAKMVYKFNRWHHYVDYSGFNQELKLKENITIINKNNENGVKIVRIPRDICDTEFDNKYYIENLYNKDNSIRVDNTNLYL